MDPLDQQLYENLRGNFDKGWELSKYLEQERPGCNRAAFNRGWHLIQQGKIQEGFEHLDRGRWENVFGSLPLKTNKPIPKPSDNLKDKHILLRSEGGLGDEIINVRYVKFLKDRGAKVTVSASRTNMELFSYVKGVDSIVERNYEQFIYHDYWIPAMSAIRVTGHEFNNLPYKKYIEAPAPWQLPGDFKVGIRWSGNPNFDHEKYRRFPAEPLIDLHKIEGVTLFSLQRDENLKDLPPAIYDMKDMMNTMTDTANIIAGLDLVITSCTSVAHLAGAMGKETWVIVPILPYYMWAYPSNKSIWYEDVWIYRQTEFMNWDPILNYLKDDLINKRELNKNSFN